MSFYKYSTNNYSSLNFSTFWPCVFAFFMLFGEGFWDFKIEELKHKNPPVETKQIDGIFNFPPLILPQMPLELKENKLDPHSKDTANDSQGNKSIGLLRAS